MIERTRVREVHFVRCLYKVNVLNLSCIKCALANECLKSYHLFLRDDYTSRLRYAGKTVSSCVCLEYIFNSKIDTDSVGEIPIHAVLHDFVSFQS